MIKQAYMYFWPFFSTPYELSADPFHRFRTYVLFTIHSVVMDMHVGQFLHDIVIYMIPDLLVLQFILDSTRLSKYIDRLFVEFPDRPPLFTGNLDHYVMHFTYPRWIVGIIIFFWYRWAM